MHLSMRMLTAAAGAIPSAFVWLANSKGLVILEELIRCRFVGSVEEDLGNGGRVDS